MFVPGIPTFPETYRLFMQYDYQTIVFILFLLRYHSYGMREEAEYHYACIFNIENIDNRYEIPMRMYSFFFLDTDINDWKNTNGGIDNNNINKEKRARIAALPQAIRRHPQVRTSFWCFFTDGVYTAILRIPCRLVQYHIYTCTCIWYLLNVEDLNALWLRSSLRRGEPFERPGAELGCGLDPSGLLGRATRKSLSMTGSCSGSVSCPFGIIVVIEEHTSYQVHC